MWIACARKKRHVETMSKRDKKEPKPKTADVVVELLTTGKANDIGKDAAIDLFELMMDDIPEGEKDDMFSKFFGEERKNA